MKRLSVILFLCMGLAVMVGMTACDDDDDDGDGNDVSVGNSALAAPTLIMPDNGATLIVATLQWSAVSGASSYIVEINGSTIEVTGTSYKPSLEAGDYQWRVWARDSDGLNGQPSGKKSFKIITVQNLDVVEKKL